MEAFMKTKPKQFIQVCMASFFLAGIFYFTVNLWRTLRYHEWGIKDRILTVLQFHPAVFLLYFLFAFFLLLFLTRCAKQTGEFLYRYRYLIALTIWILCILFELNGSSVAEWCAFLGLDPDSCGLLIGTSRGIRTDEWATYTPMMLSQQFNASGSYPYFSEIIRGTTTDTFIVYGLPVKDIAVLFRPFHWGFLFLDFAKGFSFYWCGRIIALFLVSFEMGMLITKKNKKYSFFTAVLMTLSPTVQWWLGVNCLVEMLVFGQLAILLIYHYMNTENLRYRILFGIGLIFCAGGFILSVYPAWQITIGYIILALLIWIVLENWKNFRFRAKYDIPLILICLLILATGMVYIFTKSAEMISATSASVYPGQRISSGGGYGLQAFRWPGNFFFSIFSGNMQNPCESTSFIDFAPLGILMSLYVLLREKTRDKLLIILLAFHAFLTAHTIWILPALLTKITMLNNVAAGRVIQVIGILDIFLLFRSMTLLKTRPGRIPSAGISLVFAGILTIINGYLYSNYLSKTLLVGLFLAVWAGCYLFLTEKKKPEGILIVPYLTLLLFISGGLVNPVQKGFDFLYGNDLMKEIQDIVEDDPNGLWICDNVGYPMNDFSIMGGARTIDSIHIYPDLERWALLDETGKYEDVYNRYAHITTILQKEPTEFTLDGMVDAFTLHLDTDDLEKLNVTYILSGRNLEELNTEKVQFTKLGDGCGFQLYKVKYQ